MPHTVESTISLSERDLARGAVDLTPEVDPPVNSTLLEAAVSIVKEAGPKIVEVISSHLVPVLRPRVPESIISSPVGSGGNYSVSAVPEVFTVPEVFVSQPVETIVVVPPTNQSLYPQVTFRQDTVRCSLFC
jgi:hypothetical protein